MSPRRVRPVNKGPVPLDLEDSAGGSVGRDRSGGTGGLVCSLVRSPQATNGVSRRTGLAPVYRILPHPVAPTLVAPPDVPRGHPRQPLPQKKA
jgi:hypothetical protein